MAIIRQQEHSDEYYFEKYGLSHDELIELKAKIAKIGDSDLLIEDLLNTPMTISFSSHEKVVYLKKLRGKLVKILCLIEEENEDHVINAMDYIGSVLFDVNAANLLFQDGLVEIMVKIQGILDYKKIPYKTIRKKIFETRGLVDNLIKKNSSSDVM